MTDVQVSNARRISFTALALVSFWVLAWNAYWIGLDIYCGDGFLLTWWESIKPLRDKTWWWPFFANHAWIAVGPTMALLPTLALWVSDRGLRLRARYLVSCGLLITLSLSFVFWLASSDFEAANDILVEDYGLPTTERGYDNLYLATRNLHTISWLWFLLPIILTTAFVIFGAWRSAARDAEVEVVGEDE